LLSFFQRENGESGEADYHSFKTQAANVSSLQSVKNLGGYCQGAERLFEAGLDATGANLAWLVTSQWLAADEHINTTCLADASAARSAAPKTRPYEPPTALAPPPPEPSMGN